MFLRFLLKIIDSVRVCKSRSHNIQIFFGENFWKIESLQENTPFPNILQGEWKCENKSSDSQSPNPYQTLRPTFSIFYQLLFKSISRIIVYMHMVLHDWLLLCYVMSFLVFSSRSPLAWFAFVAHGQRLIQSQIGPLFPPL